jgi:hypothetical protein
MLKTLFHFSHDSENTGVVIRGVRLCAPLNDTCEKPCDKRSGKGNKNDDVFTVLIGPTLQKILGPPFGHCRIGLCVYAECGNQDKGKGRRYNVKRHGKKNTEAEGTGAEKTKDNRKNRNNGIETKQQT